MAIDWCTRADVEAALDLLAKTYGSRPSDEDTGGWYAELARFPGVVVIAAAGSFGAEFFPNRLTFVRHVETVARDRARSTREDQYTEQQEFEVAPPVDRETARLFVRAMREAMTTAVEPAQHENHDANGGDRCPVCSTKVARGEMIAAEAQRILLEAGVVVDLGTPLYACAECRDVGAVVVDEATFTTRPCSRCTPGGFLLWKHGHYRPGHSCKDCASDKAKRAWLAQVVAGPQSQHGPEREPEDEQIRADFA